MPLVAQSSRRPSSSSCPGRSSSTPPVVEDEPPPSGAPVALPLGQPWYRRGVRLQAVPAGARRRFTIALPHQYRIVGAAGRVAGTLDDVAAALASRRTAGAHVVAADTAQPLARLGASAVERGREPRSLFDR